MSHPFAAALGALLLLAAPALAQAQERPHTEPLVHGNPPPQHLTGLSSSSWAAKSRDQVKKALEDKGFTDIVDLRQDKGGWTAKAQKGGEAVHVQVDQNGNISTK